MEQTPNEVGQQIQKEPLIDRENVPKTSGKIKNNSNISIINHTSLLGVIQKEALATRETVQKSHDYIREAMLTLKKEIVSDVLQELNPRLNELEDLLKEVKNEIATKDGESDFESDSEHEAENPEEAEIQQENQQNPAENLRGGEVEANNNRGRGRERRGRGQYSRPRDSRIFYLLRQLDRERGLEMANDRFRPYRPRERGENNRDGYRRRNERRGYWN